MCPYQALYSGFIIAILISTCNLNAHEMAVLCKMLNVHNFRTQNVDLRLENAAFLRCATDNGSSQLQLLFAVYKILYFYIDVFEWQKAIMKGQKGWV